MLHLEHEYFKINVQFWFKIVTFNQDILLMIYVNILLK